MKLLKRFKRTCHETSESYAEELIHGGVFSPIEWVILTVLLTIGLIIIIPYVLLVILFDFILGSPSLAKFFAFIPYSIVVVIVVLCWKIYLIDPLFIYRKKMKGLKKSNSGK